MKQLILTAILLVTLASCSSPLDRPYKQDTLEEDVIDLKEELTDEELGMIAGIIAMNSMTGDKMLGDTYGDLLADAKELKKKRELQEKEEKELAEKSKLEEADRVERLSKALTVSLFEKGYSKYNYQDYITYKFAFNNKSGKDVKAFTGKMIFSDLFDKEISSLNLTYDDGIPANSTINWDAQTDYNEFIDKDVTLRSKDIDDLKILWIPEKIIYSDGSTIE
jgi:hypothetical protein